MSRVEHLPFEPLLGCHLSPGACIFTFLHHRLYLRGEYPSLFGWITSLKSSKK